MKYLKAFLLSLSVFIYACQPKKQANKEVSKTEKSIEESIKKFTNKGHELIYNMTQKVGGYDLIREKKDVIYTYTYTVPDGKTDISTEKYLFDGELSYGDYKQHQRTLPQLEGNIEQGFDGKNYWIKHNKKEVTEAKAIKRAAFSRPTNFYWFTMFQKLLDPGLVYEYIGTKNIDDTNYDIVKISFRGDKPSDIYQVYINQKTNLIDQFLFTVIDFGVVETPLLMKVKYEEIDGLMIPTQRQYKKSTWDAIDDSKPWINVTWTNIKFNNGLTQKDFMK